MDRLKTKRTVRRTRSTRPVNEGSSELQRTLPDIVSLQILYDRLSAANKELSAANDEIETLIHIKVLESELTVAV